MIDQKNRKVKNSRQFKDTLTLVRLLPGSAWHLCSRDIWIADILTKNQYTSPSRYRNCGFHFLIFFHLPCLWGRIAKRVALCLACGVVLYRRSSKSEVGSATPHALRHVPCAMCLAPLIFANRYLEYRKFSTTVTSKYQKVIQFKKQRPLCRSLCRSFTSGYYSWKICS